MKPSLRGIGGRLREVALLYHAASQLLGEPQQRLTAIMGRTEVENENLKADVKAEKETLYVKNQIGGMSDAAVDDPLRKRWR